MNGYDIIDSTYHTRNPGLALPMAIVISSSILVGTIGNIFLIVAVLLSKELRVCCNYFIINLALADLFISCVSGPLHLAGIFGGESFFEARPGLCNVIASLCLLVCSSSVLNIAAIAVNRYVRILHRSRYHSIYSSGRTTCFCICVWLVGVMFNVPYMFGWGSRWYDRKTMSCLWDRQASKSFTFTFIPLSLVPPMLMTLFCYYKIYMQVSESNSRVSHLAANNKNKGESKTLTLAKTSAIIFTVFVACWTPYGICVLGDLNNTWSPFVHGWSVVIAHVNSCLNVFIYGYTNMAFRRAYNRTIHCRCHPGENSSTIHPQKGNSVISSD